PADDILEFIVYITLFVMSGITIGRIKKMIALLYAVVIIETMNLCYGIFNSISCILFPFVFAASPKITGLLFMGISSILSLILAVFCYTVIEKYLRSAENDSRQYILMILTPMLLILFVSEYISQKIYGNTVIIGSNGEAILNSSPYHMLLIQILGIVSLFCILYTYKKMVQSFQLSRQVSLLEQEACSLSQYVEEAKTRFEKTKSFRHDIKNHITVMKELVQNNQLESALQYIGDMESMTSDMSFPVSTNNPVLDILLGNKLGLAISRQISVECSLVVPYPSKISDIDFCIVLSNALDNAISACGQMEDDAGKFIYISGKIQESFLIIEVQNSYSGKKAVNKGTGIANIKAVAEKYQGAMDIKTDGRNFTLSVLFIIPQHSDYIPQQMNKERIKNCRNGN
ncbi:MAG: GHKL domain-containing protein, partial [Lachnospiraceae bacterium]|nr:GHKL domain-containing protein [Lachnospiraceae bacterium]